MVFSEYPPMSTTTHLVALTSLQVNFTAFLPRIKLHAKIYFRHLNCPQMREDAIAEAIALAWKWYLGLAEKGKDAAQFVSALASYAARAVNSGRRLCGQEKTRDALSTLAQQLHDFKVNPLPNGIRRRGNVFDEALEQNMQTPVPDQVAFRADFPAWRLTRTDRDRRLIDDLLVGERTLDVARKYGLSPARVSQLRREFHADWNRFCAEPAVASKVLAEACFVCCCQHVSRCE
jgi:hypothetical protein